MAVRYKVIDHDTPLLLPPSLREWVPGDHLVHVIMGAVEELDLGGALANARGSGDAQYPPGMLLALLIYSYATGTFSSRKIERASYDHVPTRYLCGDTHPDHDTICTFRRENGELFARVFGFDRTQSDRLLVRTSSPRVDGYTNKWWRWRVTLPHETACKAGAFLVEPHPHSAQHKLPRCRPGPE